MSKGKVQDNASSCCKPKWAVWILFFMELRAFEKLQKGEEVIQFVLETIPQATVWRVIVGGATDQTGKPNSGTWKPRPVWWG